MSAGLSESTTIQGDQSTDPQSREVDEAGEDWDYH